MSAGWPALSVEPSFTGVQPQHRLIAVAADPRYVPHSIGNTHSGKTDDEVVTAEIVTKLQSTVHDLTSRHTVHQVHYVIRRNTPGK